MSAWGFLLFTGWAATAAVLISGWWLVGLLLIELTFGLVCNRQGLRTLRLPGFWTVVLTAVVVGALFIGEPGVTWGPLPLSRAGLVIGLEMAGRASALMLAFNLGLGALSLSDIVALFERLGLHGLGFAIALALNLLETLQEMATVTLQTIWLRGGIRRPWLALRLFLITTVANTIRYGDEVINAAAVRAFDPNQPTSSSVALKRTDVWLMIALSGCTGVLLVQWLW